MRHVWGATWCLVRGPLVGPFSVRLTTLSARETLTARDVIPRNWTPKATYTSRLNFEPSLYSLGRSRTAGGSEATGGARFIGSGLCLVGPQMLVAHLAGSQVGGIQTFVFSCICRQLGFI